MFAPLLSIATLAAELIVTSLVYFIIVDAYRRGTFRTWLAVGVLAYEVLFNISYMLSRLVAGTDAGHAEITTPYETGLAIFHGTFSLVMFLALVAFFIAAARGYARGANFFRDHARLTVAFSVAWAVSILSGILFFVALYLV